MLGSDAALTLALDRTAERLQRRGLQHHKVAFSLPLQENSSFYARAASITSTHLVDMIVFPSNPRLMFFSVIVYHSKKKRLILV
jgi:hypothetical protein